MLVEIEPGVRMPRTVVVLTLLMPAYHSLACHTATGKDKDGLDYKTTIYRLREIERKTDTTRETD
jgi:hypothetical protein